jgi:hypothetical protein
MGTKNLFQKGHAGYWKGKQRGPWSGRKRAQETVEKMRINKRGTYAGARHWNWRGGITKPREFLRKMSEYVVWRTAIYERDNYTCQSCSRRGGDLEADHHPKPFAQILDENQISNREQARQCAELWNTDNGRTLCKPCHRMTYTGVPKNNWKSYVRTT